MGCYLIWLNLFWKNRNIKPKTITTYCPVKSVAPIYLNVFCSITLNHYDHLDDCTSSAFESHGEPRGGLFQEGHWLILCPRGWMLVWEGCLLCSFKLIVLVIIYVLPSHFVQLQREFCFRHIGQMLFWHCLMSDCYYKLMSDCKQVCEQIFFLLRLVIFFSQLVDCRLISLLVSLMVLKPKMSSSNRIF